MAPLGDWRTSAAGGLKTDDLAGFSKPTSLQMREYRALFPLGLVVDSKDRILRFTMKTKSPPVGDVFDDLFVPQAVDE